MTLASLKTPESQGLKPMISANSIQNAKIHQNIPAIYILLISLDQKHISFFCSRLFANIRLDTVQDGMRLPLLIWYRYLPYLTTTITHAPHGTTTASSTFCLNQVASSKRSSMPFSSSGHLVLKLRSTTIRTNFSIFLDICEASTGLVFPWYFHPRLGDVFNPSGRCVYLCKVLVWTYSHTHTFLVCIYNTVPVHTNSDFYILSYIYLYYICIVSNINYIFINKHIIRDMIYYIVNKRRQERATRNIHNYVTHMLHSAAHHCSKKLFRR